MVESGVLEVDVFGELRVARGEAIVSLPPSRKVRALLVYLLVTGRAHRRARLCDLLWDDAADDPRAALRWCLSKIRRLVDDAECKRLVADREKVELELSSISGDLTRLRSVCENLPKREVGELQSLADALQGEPLEGLELYEHPTYHAWCIAERQAAHELRLSLFRELARRHADDPERAAAAYRRIALVEPLDLDARSGLIEALIAGGRRSEAESELEATRRAFVDLTGSEPIALKQLDAQLRANTKPVPHAAPAEPRPELPRSPLVRTTIHGLRLIGRQAEVAEIAKRLDWVKEHGRSQVVLVTGEPGVGKSRLLVELMTEARRRRGCMLETVAFEAEMWRPYGPWIDALRRLAPSATAGKVALAALLSSESASPTSREALFSEVAEVLRARAREKGPMLVAVDDIQWLDSSSADLLHVVIRRLANESLLFVLTVRTGELEDNEATTKVLRSLRKDRMLEEHELGPLERDEVGALIQLIQSQADLEMVFRESGGNPLYALEIARSSKESPEPSSTVSRLVHDRIERMSAEHREALVWAAAIGPTFRVSILEQLVNQGDEALVEALEELESNSLVVGVVDLQAPGDKYQFAHYVVYRVVYGDISPPRRRLMHSRIADVLRETGGPASELAHHAMEAGRPEIAARAAVDAARHCLELFAPSQALAIARRGLTYAEQLPEPEKAEIVGRLRLVIGAASDHPTAT